ncbi:hypothetical protein TcasGA2_TC003266 [Tribolium castaneum]|uniref:Uncharacterized protein n=1 Tax=Tribolium castaneum TaxID=7070 RepID=D6WEH6_TRICA|nr:hypothetical protein TcasGA2_TC003266 [Tribolium castaneum]
MNAKSGNGECIAVALTQGPPKLNAFEVVCYITGFLLYTSDDAVRQKAALQTLNPLDSLSIFKP